ncbi:MAG: aminoacyl-tRNA hydrolase [Chlamydiae bacterium RIFCSPHIGHO2_12_FULL_49_11]|nr:MAG: aminoacyl-tRNA hydrolase [Chlamydiae bacterium RIFCSPHIGHO2_12_FULL_49_11]
MSVEKLVVGLGNPGSRYARSRHNIGAKIVTAYAREEGLKPCRLSLIKAKLWQGKSRGREVVAAFPTTYMNASGTAVKRCMTKHKVGPQDMLVVVDDVHIPFGRMRYREQGSSGGQKGMQSIIECLGTIEFPRLRIGVSEPAGEEMEQYVLSPFSVDEEARLLPLVEAGVNMIKMWIENPDKMSHVTSNVAID